MKMFREGAGSSGMACALWSAAVASRKRLYGAPRFSALAGRDACPTKATLSMVLVAQASVPAIVGFTPSKSILETPH